MKAWRGVYEAPPVVYLMRNSIKSKVQSYFLQANTNVRFTTPHYP